jgi:CubicO group peptidase (beta-lactamase class C family)
MRPSPLLLLPALLGLACPAPGLAQARAPGDFVWKTSSPEARGFSPEKLNAARDELARLGTHELLVIRNDSIVLEWYAKGYTPETPHNTASLAKALVGGLSLSLALSDGRLRADDPAWKYVPQWKNDPVRSKITVAELATHSAGLEDAELSDADVAAAKARGATVSAEHMKLPGWKGSFWRLEDPFVLARDETPILWTPGTEFHYSNPGMAMLSYVVTSSYRGARYSSIRDLLRERIMEPIGIRDDEWQVGYGKTFQTDGLNIVPNWGGEKFTARATARIGRLMLHKGNWQGKQLIDPKVVEQVTTYHGAPAPSRDDPFPASGLAWYVNFDGVWPDAPRDTFCGAGAGDRTLIVIPSLNMIIVRYGEDMFDAKKGEGFWYGIHEHLVKPVMASLTDRPEGGYTRN